MLNKGRLALLLHPVATLSADAFFFWTQQPTLPWRILLQLSQNLPQMMQAQGKGMERDWVGAPLSTSH